MTSRCCPLSPSAGLRGREGVMQTRNAEARDGRMSSAVLPVLRSHSLFRKGWSVVPGWEKQSKTHLARAFDSGSPLGICKFGGSLGPGPGLHGLFSARHTKGEIDQSQLDSFCSANPGLSDKGQPPQRQQEMTT